MPSTPNTRPTLITDKNGKVTTVHKRVQSEGKTPRLIPAPVASYVEDMGAVRTESLNLLLAEIPHKVGSRSYRVIATSLQEGMEKMPDDLVREVYQTMNRFPASADAIQYSLWKKLEPNEVQEVVRFASRTENFDRNMIFQVSGLHLYSELPKSDNYAREDELVQRQCDALLTVSSCLLAFDGSIDYVKRGHEIVTKIKDASLVKFLIENPNSADVVVRYIETRGENVDLGVVQEMSDLAAPLAGGAL